MSVSDFLPPGRLVELVTEVVSSVRRAEERSATDSDRNTIDPFSAIFDAALKGVSADEWMTLELARQNQKSLQNAIGTFHQRLLGSVDGWEDQAAGGSVDLRNDARTVIAEVKNKYNTMNSSSSEATYKKLADHLRYTDKHATAYLVQIVPKTSTRYDRAWTYNRLLAPERSDIRVIDGASFYALVTGRSDALAEVYDELPAALAGVLGYESGQWIAGTKAAKLFNSAYGV